MLSMDFRYSNGNYAKVGEMTHASLPENKGESLNAGPISQKCPVNCDDQDATNLSNNSNTYKVPESPSADDIFSTPHSSVTSLNRTLPLKENNDCNCALLKEKRRCAKERGVVSNDMSDPTRNKDTRTYRNKRKSKYCFLFKCCMAKKKKERHESGISSNSDVFPRQESVLYADDADLHDEPLRKRIIRACFTLLYFVLASVAVVVTYSMVSELVHSMNNPVRSIHYQKNDIYEAPGIAVYPGGADLLACGHYYNNVVTSKVRLEDLDLLNRNCSFTDLEYTDPHYPNVSRNALIFRGPTSFKEREAVFLHFELEDETRDFFTVSYFVFPKYDIFDNSSRDDQAGAIIKYHRYVPTFALSSGLRMWIKLIMSQTYLLDGTEHTEFKVEYSVVKFHDRRDPEDQKKKLFFIFFEWKNDITEQSFLLYTTTPWSMLAGLCGVFLTLHRGYQLAQTSYKRVQKDKQRRTIRKRRLEELRRSRNSSAAYSRQESVPL